LDKAPELAYAVHKDYILSGSDIILTASYKASIDDFVRHEYTEEKAVTLIKKSVELAKSARDEAWAEIVKNDQNGSRPFPLVAASVSSYGAFLYGEEYTGNYNGISDEDLAIFHRKQMHLLAGEKPDILAIETVPCLQEVKVFLKLI
jgi:homocysteine S-methyltransferase